MVASCDNGQPTANHLVVVFSSFFFLRFIRFLRVFLGVHPAFGDSHTLPTKTKINYKAKPNNRIRFIDILITAVTTGATTNSNGV